MAQFVDNPWPTSLELPRLQEPRPRYNGLKNLRYGPGTGRTKGVQNKICRDLKEGLLESAILHGYNGAGEGGLVGFCLHLAERHPKVHGHLLAKLLPYNLNANVATATIGEVRVISVPPDHYFPKGATESNLGPLEYIPPAEPVTPTEPARASATEASATETEEEERIIRDLKDKINALAQRAGMADVV